WASSASIHAPDSRVSRPTRIFIGGLAPVLVEAPANAERTSAAPSRRTRGGSSGECPALPRTAAGPDNPGAASILATGDWDLYGRWLDARHSQVGCRSGADVERIVLTGPEPGEVDERDDVVGVEVSHRVAVAAQCHVDGGGHRLGLKVRPDVTQVHRAMAHDAFERRRNDLNGDRRCSRRLQPQRGIEQPERHRLADGAPGAAD